MRNLLVALMLTLATVAHAAETKSLDVSECSRLWKEHKAKAEYVDPGKYHRMNAWYEFRRKTCSKDRIVKAN